MTPPHQHADNPNAKRILIVCDEGINRSHTIKGQLQYWGHDILTVGLNRNDLSHTIPMLAEWAHLIIVTDKDQRPKLAKIFKDWNNGVPDKKLYDKIQLWDIGEDKFPRPYNPELLSIVRKLIDEHRDELAPIKDKT